MPSCLWVGCGARSQLISVFCGPSASASGESARRCPYRPQSARAAGRLGAAGSPHFRVGNRPPDARDACPVWPVGARGSGVADRQGRRSYRAGLAFKSCRPAVSTASRRTRRWSRGERASGSVQPGPPVLATAVVGHFSRLSGCLLVAQGSSGRRAARAAAGLRRLAFNAASRRGGAGWGVVVDPRPHYGPQNNELQLTAGPVVDGWSRCAAPPDGCLEQWLWTA